MDKRRKYFEAMVQAGLFKPGTPFEKFDSALNDPEKSRQIYDLSVNSGFISGRTYQQFSQSMSADPLSTEQTSQKQPHVQQPSLGDPAISGGLLYDPRNAGSSLTPTAVAHPIERDTFTGKENIQQTQKLVDVPTMQELEFDLGPLSPFTDEELSEVGLTQGMHMSQEDKISIEANRISKYGSDLVQRGVRHSSKNREALIPDIIYGKYEQAEEGEPGMTFYDPHHMKRVRLSEEGSRQFKSDFIESVSGKPLDQMTDEEYQAVVPLMTDMFLSDYVPEQMIDDYAKANNFDFDKSKSEQFWSQLGVGFSSVFGDAQAMVDRIALEGLATILTPDVDSEKVSGAIDLMIDSNISPSYGMNMRNQWRDFAESQTTNPEFTNDFWLSDVPQALGSGSAFLVSGLATGGAGTVISTGTMATLGALSNSESQYEDARKHGANDNDAWLSALIGAGVGVMEAMPLSRALGRISKSNPGASKALLDRISRTMYESGKEGVEEAIQETLTQIANDFSAQTIVGYDPERVVFDEDLIKSAELGFISGMIMTGSVRAVAESKGALDDEMKKHLIDLQGKLDQQFQGTDMEALIGKGLEGTSLEAEAQAENSPNQSINETTTEKSGQLQVPEKESESVQKSEKTPSTEEESQEEKEVSVDEREEGKGTGTDESIRTSGEIVREETESSESKMETVLDEGQKGESVPVSPEEVQDTGQADRQDRSNEESSSDDSSHGLVEKIEKEVRPEENSDSDPLPSTREEAEESGFEVMNRSRTDYFIKERDNKGRILSAYRFVRGKPVQYKGRVNDQGIFEVVDSDGNIVPRGKTLGRALYSSKRKDLSQDRQLIQDTREELENDFNVAEDEKGKLQFSEELNDTLAGNPQMREKTVEQLDEISSRFDEMNSDMATGFVSKLNDLANRLANMDQDQQAVLDEIQEIEEKSTPDKDPPKLGTPERRSFEESKVDRDPNANPLQVSRTDRREFRSNVRPEQLREAKIALLSGNVSDATIELANSPEVRSLHRNGNTWAAKIRNLVGQKKKEQKKAANSERVSAQNSALKTLRETGVQERINNIIKGSVGQIKKAVSSLTKDISTQIVGGQTMGRKDLQRAFDEMLEDNPEVNDVYQSVVEELVSSEAITDELAQKLGLDNEQDLAQVIAQKQMFTSRGRRDGRFMDGNLDNNFAVPIADSISAETRKELGDIHTTQMKGVWESFGSAPINVATRFSRRLINRLFRRFPDITIHEGLTLEEYQQSYRDSLGGVLDVAQYPLGFVWNSEIYFNPAFPPSPATQVHELAHIWLHIAREKYPSLVKRGIALIENTAYMQQAEQDYGLRDDAGLLNIEQIREEALVEAITDGARNLVHHWDSHGLARFRKWLSNFWNRISGYFGINTRNRAELNNGAQTLAGFARMIANDILSDVPIGMIRSVDLNHAVQNNNSASASQLRIDDGLLAVRLDRTIPSEIKSWFDQGIQATRNLPRWVDNHRRIRLSRIEASRVRAKKLVERLHQAVNNEFGADQRIAVYTAINETLTNRVEYFNFITNNQLNFGGTFSLDVSPEIVQAVVEMRTSVDALTRQMINSGMLSQGNEVAFNANLGLYLHRSYQVHENPRWANYIENNQPQIWQNAVDFLIGEMSSRNITNIRIETRQDSDGNDINDLRFVNQHGIHWEIRGVNDSYLKSLVGMGIPLVPTSTSTVDSSTSGLTTVEINVDPTKPFTLPQAFGNPNNYLPESATSYLRSFLESHQPNEQRFFIPTTEGAMKHDIITRRGTIPEQIRAVMGEHTDPRVNFMKSMIKQVSLIESFRYQQALAQEGSGILFDQDNPTRNSGPFTERIASDGNTSFQPLAGYYTTPEIKACLDVAFSPKHAQGRMMQGVLMLNSWAKSMATVHNIAGQMRNILSAGIMVGNTGAFFTLFRENGRADFLESLTDALRVTKELFNKTGGPNQARWEHLAQLGVINDNLNLSIIRDSLKRSQLDFRADGGGLLNRLRQSGVGRFLENYNSLMENLYQMPDDAVKVVLFNIERSTLQRAYPDMGDAELDIRAADLVKATLPVYSKAPKFVKSLSRNPVVGTFVSFTTEMYRTMVINTPRIAVEEMRSENPIIRNRGIARMSGLVLGGLAFMSAGAISAFMMGIDAEEEEAIRESLPPWARHSALMFFGKNDDGKHIVYDMSNLDPMSVIVKPFVSAFGISNAKETWTKKLALFFEPFIGTEIGLGAFLDVVMNDKDAMADMFSDKPTYQKKIRSPITGTPMMIWDVMMYLAGKLGPRSFNTLAKIGQGAVSDLLPKDKKDYKGTELWLKEWAEKEPPHDDISPFKRSFAKESIELISGTKGYHINPEAASFFQGHNYKSFLSSIKSDKQLDKYRGNAERLVEKEFSILNRKVNAFVREGFISHRKMFGTNGILRKQVGLDKKSIDALKKGIFDPKILEKR